ncbi:hypothetical protein [Demequina muriae]|uniref:DUF5667 domain-containing protein n=1 Tax=Demequina muriae TaxID=3051664 RepID=A0ABT8GIP3_9MICO|nr:hypothetical protein [Demequina sp. EGI L300058]MDN4481300.1 hypothetical protein [Demequina sp. EGI L300058]
MTRNVRGPSSDDHSEMTTDEHFSDRDLNALFSGRAIADARLAELGPVMAALRSTSADAPSDDQVAAMAVALSRAVPATTDGGVARAHARPSPRRGSALSRRLVAIVAGAGLVGVGFAGAAAADGAAPGDTLYGLDRALEAVGINNGGAHERLAEVRVLLETGDVDGALVHAEQATDELDPEATEALRAAAESVASAGSDQSREVREQVSAMLMWMSETDLEGREFGQGVAERARAIGNGNDPAATDGVTSENPDAAAEGNAGKSQQTRPPVGDDRGASGDAGQSDGGAKPESKGGSGAPAKPEDAAPPADAGSPSDSKSPAEPGPAEDSGKTGKSGSSGDTGKPENPGEDGKNAGGGRP